MLITWDSWIIFANLYSARIMYNLNVAPWYESTSDTLNYVSLSTAILLW